MLDTSEQIFPYIIFTDESRFCNSPDNYMCWRKKNDFTESATVQKAKKSLSLMVWGGIGYNFKSQLYFHNGAVRGQEYRECLKETNFFNQADEQFGKGGYIFQQDGATCHTREDINKMGRHVTQEKILYNLLINKVECFMVGLQIVQIYHQLKWSGRT